MPTLLFLRDSSTPTPCRRGPSLEDVFASGHDAHARRFLPLVSVDLAAIDPTWSGVAHFVYYDLYDDKLTFRVVDRKYEYDGDYGECNPLEEVDVTLSPGFFELVPLDIPEQDGVWEADPVVAQRAQAIWKGDPKRAQAAADYVYWETMQERVEAQVDRRASLDSRFGGRPVWTQSDQTPRNSRGEPMRFVGQLSASRIGGSSFGPFELFLFVDAVDKVAVQISQTD